MLEVKTIIDDLIETNNKLHLAQDNDDKVMEVVCADKMSRIIVWFMQNGYVIP